MIDDLVTTEITVVGANCPWCFNETVEMLRCEPGVNEVTASIGTSCLCVEHHGVAIDRLLAVVRGHLHADEVTSGEHVMVAVDPLVAELHCAHCRRQGGAGRDV